MGTSFLCTKHLTRDYVPGTSRPALDDVSLSIQEGGLTAIVGPSGSGKSTLLHLAAALDRPDRGRMIVGGIEISALTPAAAAAWRGRAVGLVFQSYLLLPTLTAAENVVVPMELTGAVARHERRARALALLGGLGLADLADRRPSQMSGGQQQRVAIARAIACDPPLILADEPTGNLDTESGRTVLAQLRALADAGRTVVMVTHDADAAGRADRVVRFVDGRVALGGEVVA